MNLHEFLRQPVVAPAWSGDWVRLWLRPDIFSAQEYLVGAAALDERGLVDFRVISGAQKFECIYGEGNKQMFERMLAELRSALQSYRVDRRPITPAALPPVFRMESVGAMKAQLVSEALDRMLRDGSMPMEEDVPKGKKARFASRAASEVIADVLNRVRDRAGLTADRFICEDYYGDQRHQVGVNLVTQKAAGVVASGWYAATDRIQLEFLLGADKLDTYVAATGRHRDKSAFFFMRPTLDDGLPRAVASEVESRLDDLTWRLEKRNIRTVVLSDASAIAEQVCEWAEAAA